MKTIIKILVAAFVVYAVWTLYINPSHNTAKQQKTETIHNTQEVKGTVTNNFSLFNHSVIVVQELSSMKKYYILTKGPKVPKIGSPVIVKIKKYDIIKINDKSLALYEQVGPKKH